MPAVFFLVGLGAAAVAVYSAVHGITPMVIIASAVAVALVAASVVVWRESA